jgi:hypothetical protein
VYIAPDLDPPPPLPPSILFSQSFIVHLERRDKAQRDFTVRGQSNVWRLPKYRTPTPHLPANVYSTHHRRGEDTFAGRRGGGGSILWKTPDTALYSTYVSILCGIRFHFLRILTTVFRKITTGQQLTVVFRECSGILLLDNQHLYYSM